MQSHLSIFALVAYAFWGPIQKVIAQTSAVELFPYVSSSNFTVSDIIFVFKALCHSFWEARKEDITISVLRKLRM